MCCACVVLGGARGAMVSSVVDVSCGILDWRDAVRIYYSIARVVCRVGDVCKRVCPRRATPWRV